ncbi:TSCPD domain-containing protein [Actinocorallia populi]|uniref:TSCPD domain-containing protein n=1 Tax=Actinocorallia populi TaxID=2079200 RepID=UPI000D0967CF|nr:hypothetical protein [Actinocorallia populi]
MTTSSGVPARIETSETEVLITWGEPGTTTAGLAETLSTVLTVALRSGVPAYPLVEELLDLRFVPHGPTGDSLVPSASSVADHVARRLAFHHLTPEERHKLGISAPGSPWPDAYTQAPNS